MTCERPPTETNGATSADKYRIFMRTSYKKRPEKKTVGTAAPLRSLRSRSAGAGDADGGTFETGRRFLAWLKRTGQGAWQLLPISAPCLEDGSPSVRVPSPYKGYGIGLDPRYISPAMRRARPSASALKRFKKRHAWWIGDYALFGALTKRFGTDDWTRWPAPIRDRRGGEMRRVRKEMAEACQAEVIEQWRAHADFEALRRQAKRLGIRLMGDLPFYFPLQSPLTWANRDCFDLAAGRLRHVSGVPDGPQSHFGRQVWGHPLYAWNRRKDRPAIARLWLRRIGYKAGLFGMMRLDHAKGLFFYGSMDLRRPERDAVLKGPGAPLLARIVRHARAKGLTLFAEDAGDRLAELRVELHRLGVPGIRILRFAYNEKRKTIESDYAHPRSYPENAVAYTSTHDTATLMGYLSALSAAEKRLLCAEVGVAYDKKTAVLAARLRRSALEAPTRFTIVPIQDWLLTKDRINVPGTERPRGDRNWRYRLKTPVERLPMVQRPSRSRTRGR